jgi:hypothetical protein
MQVQSTVVRHSPNGTQVVQFSGADLKAVSERAMDYWKSLDAWCRDGAPTPTVCGSDGEYVATVTRWSCE